MPNRFQYPFFPINSTGPGFESTFGASTGFALESTALNRMWAGAGSRAVRLATKTGADYYITFGSSTVVSNSSDGMLVLGGAVEVFKQPKPSDTYLGVFSSTDIVLNCTLGYGQ